MTETDTFTSIILAAGYGTRLRPVTDEIPKPLIPVGNRTLLENILINCYNAGIAKFAVNTHHLPEMIEDGISNSFWKDKVSLLPEKEILGTGGPVVNAKNILTEGEGFLLHNGDILTNMDLSALVEKHRNSKSAVTMALIDGPENRVSVTSDGNIVDILGKLGRGGDEKLMTYAGIACFSQEIFDYLPPEPEFCSIVTAIIELMRENPDAVSSYQPLQDESFVWNDLGTVEKMVKAHKSIENGKLELPELVSSEMIPLPMVPLERQGSGRVFFRLHQNRPNSRIAMCASDDNEDFERFVDIGSFLHAAKLGSPEILHANMDNNTAIMEDLGNDTLFNLVAEKSDTEHESLYRKVIDWLIEFQVTTDNECIDLRTFDYDYLRWETEYFKENFLIGFCRIDKTELEGLDQEFHKLAEECLSHPQIMMHRDFQSQNILIKEDKVRIVDFQGARIGHLAYDLMSLVNDPYVNLSKDLREKLKSYYFELLGQSDIECDVDHEILANRAALQRNMQALGAYAFLSMKKGKTEYQNYIPQGLELLKETVEYGKNDFPILHSLMKRPGMI